LQRRARVLHGLPGQVQRLAVAVLRPGCHRLAAQRPARQARVPDCYAEPSGGGQVNLGGGVVAEVKGQVPGQGGQPAADPPQFLSGFVRLPDSEHGGDQGAGPMDLGRQHGWRERGVADVVVAPGRVQILGGERATGRSLDFQGELHRLAYCRQRGGLILGCHLVPVPRGGVFQGDGTPAAVLLSAGGAAPFPL
jgi:hypothetical protein